MIAASTATADDSASGDLIVATFRRVLAEAGPRQAEVLRRCAIPRWWDLAVLGVLREGAEGGERVLALLAGYSFVRPLGEGRYAFPEEVRGALLAEWWAQRPEELRAISRRLAGDFERRAAAAVAGQVTPAGMRPSGAWDLWRREALYQRLVADPQAGLDLLRAEFDEAEATYRLADAEALLQLAGETPLTATGQLWLRSLRARLDRSALRLDDAAAGLDRLLAEPRLDPALAAEAGQTLGDVLAETGQWARAIELYGGSLAWFERAGDRRRAAEVMLRLGEAYRGLGINTGGWHMPSFARSPLWGGLGWAWYSLLALPFALVVALLRGATMLPRPRYLAAYQNWLLIRLYRTALGWFDRAHAAFAALADPAGELQADRRQAEIALLFGYADRALAQLDELRARPAGQDPYRRLWLDSDRATVLLELGRTAEAQALLAEALAGFRAIGDARGEAAVLALQGRAAADTGAADAALESYRGSLARFRSLRYTAARELALYGVRAWQRRVGPGIVSGQIDMLLDQEPEKRYVARFPRSLLPLVQALVLGIAPLALVLTALVAPTTVVQRVGNLPIVDIRTIYNIGNVLVALLTLGALGLAIYTAVALAVIIFLPLEALEREQPDYLITGEREIARYDYRGALAQRISWDEIGRWVRVDRRLWLRPVALFSLTMLEAADGRDLRIDGITGWYGGLRRDIGLHLRRAGNQTAEEDGGFDVLRSKAGALLVAGGALLLLCVSAANSWIGWLQTLPFGAYVAVNMLAFSGVMILIPLTYWFVARPLALTRALSLPDRWPWIVGATGLAAVLLYLATGGAALPEAELNIGMLLWGAYVAADALYTLLLPRRRLLGRALIVASLLAAGLLAIPRGTGLFYSNLADAYASRLDYTGAAQASGAALQDASQRDVWADAWTKVGIAGYQQGSFRDAVEAYDRALAALDQQPDSAETQQRRAVILYNRAWALRQLGDTRWQQDARSACAQLVDVCQGTFR